MEGATDAESDGRSEKDKMLAGELYDASAPEIQADLAATKVWLARYNAALSMPAAARRKLLDERFAAVGEGAAIRPPFHCDYGFNIRLGAGVFLNFNCVILDVVEVTIGDKTQIGPGVQILTADHPRDFAERAAGLEFGRPIHIGRNVWIGGGAIILPGVTSATTRSLGRVAWSRAMSRPARRWWATRRRSVSRLGSSAGCVNRPLLLSDCRRLAAPGRLPEKPDPFTVMGASGSAPRLSNYPRAAAAHSRGRDL